MGQVSSVVEGEGELEYRLSDANTHEGYAAVDFVQESDSAQSAEDFVDVTTEEAQKPDTRAGSGRSARGRKRA